MESHGPDFWLFVFVFVFWTLVAAAIKLGNLATGKRWTAGPSLVPVIPFVPLSTFLLGVLIDLVVPPWGLWSVVALHAFLVCIHLRGIAKPNRG